MELAFDIESTPIVPGLPSVVERIHCISAIDLDSGATYEFGPDALSEAVRVLNAAELLTGHNILQFDLRVCRQLLPDFRPRGAVVDTLILSRVLCPLNEHHSLKHWGEVLKVPKLGAPEFDAYSAEMAEYCLADVRLTVALYRYLMGMKPFPEVSLRTEHRFAQWCSLMTERGVRFDAEEAEQLRQELAREKKQSDSALNASIPATVETLTTPEYWKLKHDGEEFQFITKNAAETARKARKWRPSACSLTAGPPRTKILPFNANSTQQVAAVLASRYGWAPQLSDKGNPKTGRHVLVGLPYPEAKEIVRNRDLDSKLGNVGEGPSSWRTLAADGFLHHTINTLAAVSSRCGHSNPNVGGIRKEPRFRRLFRARVGMCFVGCDLDSVEACLIGHYLHPWDGGVFGNEVVSGDFHTLNQKAAGLRTRDLAKRFFYATCYGAGPGLLAHIMETDIETAKAAHTQFFRNLIGLSALRSLQRQHLKVYGYIAAIDGRRVRPKGGKSYAALACLIQSAGAVLLKRWTNLACGRIGQALSSMQEESAHMVLNVHDELVFETTPGIADVVGRVLEQSAADAGATLQLKVPISASAQVGQSWAEVH